MTTHFDRLGGWSPLQSILRDFYDRVFDDLMIGYLFRGQDRERLVTLEAQFTARALGAEVAYEGRTMRAAHGPLALQAGQFDRRHQLLVETLRDHRVDAEVSEAWLGHSRALRRAVLSGPDAASGCAPPVRPRLVDGGA